MKNCRVLTFFFYILFLLQNYHDAPEFIFRIKDRKMVCLNYSVNSIIFQNFRCLVAINSVVRNSKFLICVQRKENFVKICSIY